MWNPRKYGLPLPPSRRQLTSVRNSPARALLARYRGATGSPSVPQTPPAPTPTRPAPQPPKQYVPGRKFTPISPRLKKTRNIRDALSLISAASRQGKMVRLIYRRMKDGAVVQRDVEGYSLRYLRTKAGGRARYFYAYDNGEGGGNGTVGIHSFRMNNIMGVEEIDRTFTPKWKVEF